MSRFLIKSIATLSLTVVAAASQAFTVTYPINFFLDSTGGASSTTSVPMFHPWMGTLTSVSLAYHIGAIGGNDVTNIDAVSGVFDNFVYSESYLSVHNAANTAALGDDLIVQDSHTGVALAPGGVDSVFAYNEYDNTIWGTAGVMAGFTGGGNLVVDQSSLGFAVAGGTAQTQSTGSEAAISYGYLTYEYTKNPTPAPAAAASMLIGMVGGLVRRRKSA